MDYLGSTEIDKAHLKFRSNYYPVKIEQIKILKEEEYQYAFLKKRI